MSAPEDPGNLADETPNDLVLKPTHDTVIQWKGKNQAFTAASNTAQVGPALAWALLVGTAGGSTYYGVDDLIARHNVQNGWAVLIDVLVFTLLLGVGAWTVHKWSASNQDHKARLHGAGQATAPTAQGTTSAPPDAP